VAHFAKHPAMSLKRHVDTFRFLSFYFSCGPSTRFRVMATYYGAPWSHSLDTPRSVGLLRTSDQPNVEASTWQHPTLTTDRHPWPRWDSNPQSQRV